MVCIALFALFCLYHFVGTHVLASQFAGNKTREIFAAEDAKLEHLLGLFSGTTKTPQTSCIILKGTYFTSTFRCYTHYSGIKYASTKPYTEHAAGIKQLLDTNGWLVTNQAELMSSANAVSDVAYYKNIGDVSCNLKILYNSTMGEVSINTYSCSKFLNIFDPKPTRIKPSV